MTLCAPITHGSPAIRFDALALARPSAVAHGGAVPQYPSNPWTRALDAFEDGLVLTDARSGVLYANRMARAMLASGPLLIRGGQLCAATTAATRDLHQAIAARVGQTSDAFLRVGAPSTRRALLVTVTVAESGSDELDGDEPMVFILLKDARRPQAPSADMIGRFFELTPAEARLAREMITGDGLKGCANRLGITPNTARTHLKRVFDKTGTNRQAELVRLLLSCRCPMGVRPVERNEGREVSRYASLEQYRIR